jgi:hypothetical protein
MNSSISISGPTWLSETNAVVALVQSDHCFGDGREQLIAVEGRFGCRHAAWLSRPPVGSAREAEGREPDERSTHSLAPFG